ncbi:MAG: TlyA family RNA methyltransferase [Bryobacterales bacterium]|nr:TlyA family RNA methyltransferase [Bryobacteraceae bacterium]MDW8129531.1 TlyA family RNA methyltransferase [Bryobacterales bacterium]
MSRRRLDQLLVDRGLVESRARARALILAGQVLVNGQKASKAGQLVAEQSRLEILEPMPYVSRGGLKLEAALERFGIRVEGRVCLDIGASTGGFTDCLLQRGARRVYAVDVGRGQLDWKLRQDPRVVVLEGVNARYLGREHVPEPVELAVCDVSFISVTLILPRLAPLLAPEGEMVILVKPQFEVGRGQVGKGGVVRDPELRQAACRKVAAAVESLGFHAEWFACPVPGAEGNQEFLLHARH